MVWFVGIGVSVGC